VPDEPAVPDDPPAPGVWHCVPTPETLIQARPVLHVRIETWPLPQQVCPTPPHALQVGDAPRPAQARPLPMQVRAPPPPGAPPAPLAGWQQG